MKYFIKIILSCLFISASAACFAQQQQNANIYVNWNVAATQTYTALSQALQITQKAPGTFWANSWNFSGVNYGGYVGLQTSYDGKGSEIAIFSIWNATSTNKNCNPFGGEGTGVSCRIPYTINTAHKYLLVVAKGSSTNSGQLWNAFIVDLNTSAQTQIGSIETAANVTAFNLPQNFTEYFGNSVPTCNDVPVSVVNWYQPVLTPVTGSPPVHANYSSNTRGSCTGGSAVATSVFYVPVVKTTLGGHQ